MVGVGRLFADRRENQLDGSCRRPGQGRTEKNQLDGSCRRPGQGRTEKKIIRVPGLINEGGAGTAYHYPAIHRCFSSLYIFLWGKKGKTTFSFAFPLHSFP
jgi:hypothetical protein